MTAKIAFALILLCSGAAAFAATDPSLHEVYEAANAGHLDQAQSMMVQVLRDHPRSAKAHYVAAEVYARAGRAAAARQELNAAQTLDPGLSFANPGSVSALRAELARPAYTARPAAEPRAGFPLGWAVLLGVGILALWMILRRRAASGPAPMYGGAAYNGAPAGMPPSGPMMGSGYAAPGMGAGLGSSLATGLAVGAGVVAGEQLAHHFLDGDRRTVVPPADLEGSDTSTNTDMGGNDFGISDAGSWDGGSGSDFGSGGGADDWT